MAKHPLATHLGGRTVNYVVIAIGYKDSFEKPFVQGPFALAEAQRSSRNLRPLSYLVHIYTLSQGGTDEPIDTYIGDRR